LLGAIEAAVNAGKTVVSADNSIVIAMMLEALKHGRSATFYVAPAQAQALMRIYWTPRRVKEIGMAPVSKEERAKIESELGVKDMGPWFSNRVECPCGGVYGAFEFMQQGLEVHGRNWVGAVIELKNTAVMRINPAQEAFCPRCSHVLLQGHWYEMRMPNGTLSYGCCSGPDIIIA
jgi:hypothetical protein